MVTRNQILGAYERRRSSKEMQKRRKNCRPSKLTTWQICFQAPHTERVNHPKSSGIGENGSIKWVDEVFPYDVEEILLHEGYIDDDENPENSYEPSDDNDNEFWIDLYPCHHFLADISYTCFYMD